MPGRYLPRIIRIMIATATLQRILGGTALAALAIGFIAVAMGRFSGRGGGPPPRPSVAIVVDGDSSVEIQPGQYHHYEFRLPARVCTLTGQVGGVGGANSTFEALVFSDPEYWEWLKTQRGGSMQSGEVSSWSPHLTLVGPGRFHLVVRNPGRAAPLRISILNGKATCP
jgi:hypothetical protein